MTFNNNNLKRLYKSGCRFLFLSRTLDSQISFLMGRYLNCMQILSQSLFVLLLSSVYLTKIIVICCIIARLKYTYSAKIKPLTIKALCRNNSPIITACKKMALKAIANFFRGSKKDGESEEIREGVVSEFDRCPERRLSISKSGKMRSKTKDRRSITTDTFCDISDKSRKMEVNCGSDSGDKRDLS